MKRIAIIGSSGAGKTQLARDLGFMLNIGVIHLDRFFWQSSWKGTSRDTRIDFLQSLVQHEQWIIEGTYLDSSEPRLNAADTIIFLDTPTWLCLLRIILRHLKLKGQPRLDLPDGCSDNLSLRLILKVLTFRVRHHEELSQKLHNYRSKQVIRLHSGREVKNFLAQLQQGTDEKMDSHASDSAVAALA